MENLEKELAMILMVVLRGLGRELSEGDAAAAAYSLINMSEGEDDRGLKLGIPRNIRFIRALNSLRLERGLLTNARFAEACGLQPSVVSRMYKKLESDQEYFPQLRVRLKIASGLNVDPDVLAPGGGE